jgi:predicted AAA+ superfamily ATPase
VYLLGIEHSLQLERDPAFGGLFENMVILEVLKQGYNHGKNSSLYFYQDNNQHEIDILCPKGPQYIPVEIASSRTYRKDFLKGIHYYQKISGQSDPGLLIYDGELEFEKEDFAVRNFRHLTQYLNS